MEYTRMSNMTRVQVGDLRAFSVAALRSAGLSEEDAQLAADVYVTTDTLGMYTHGTYQLQKLVINVRAGRLNPAAREHIAAEGPGWATIDGNYAIPAATATRAMRLAMQKARDNGIAYVGVFRTGHYGPAGYYANLAAIDGMLGICTCNAEPLVTVTNAAAKVLGTNPFSYAVPGGQDQTVFLDAATSVVAANKLFMARDEGLSVAEGWLLDEDARPTTDPSQFPQLGFLAPSGGYKGYGLAMLVEVLSAVMTGAAMTGRVRAFKEDGGTPIDQGHSFIAIDIGAMMPLDRFRARMDALAHEIHSARVAPDAERIYLPGEREWLRRTDALAQGLHLPDQTRIGLRLLGVQTGVDPQQYNLDLTTGD